MDAQIQELKLWRAGKDVLDNERHRANIAHLEKQDREIKKVDQKIDILISRTERQDGASLVWASWRGWINNVFLSIVSGGAVVAIWQWFHPPK